MAALGKSASGERKGRRRGKAAKASGANGWQRSEISMYVACIILLYLPREERARWVKAQLEEYASYQKKRRRSSKGLRSYRRRSAKENICKAHEMLAYEGEMKESAERKKAESFFWQTSVAVSKYSQ